MIGSDIMEWWVAAQWQLLQDVEEQPEQELPLGLEVAVIL
jgi:hypothetical protein